MERKVRWIEIERKRGKEGRGERGKKRRREVGREERRKNGKEGGKEKWVQLPTKVKTASRQVALPSSFQMNRISPLAIVRECLVHMRHNRVTRALLLSDANQAPLPNVWITQWHCKQTVTHRVVE